METPDRKLLLRDPVEFAEKVIGPLSAWDRAVLLTLLTPERLRALHEPDFVQPEQLPDAERPGLG